MSQLTVPVRDQVIAIEASMLKQPQIELPIKHHFQDGIYCREIFIPAGTLLTGKVHRHQQINMLRQGCMRVLIEAGVQEVEAVFITVSPPGTKRIALALTDCVWATFLPTDETDPDKIEEQFTVSVKEQRKWLS